MTETIVPFLKWAGGKRWLVSSRPDFFPAVTGRHIEPFAGSAALFFALSPKSALLSDLNERLIETYVMIRDSVDEFEVKFKFFASQHSKDFYYSIRQKKFATACERAAQFLYLNRVCFNGIYRENLKGEFNVPIGSKKTAILDTDNFQAVSELLKGAELVSQDFERVVESSQADDLLYVDPPYTTSHNMNGFVKYNQNIFSWEDQERLANAVRRAHFRGVSIVVSNADQPDVRALYSDFLSLYSVSRTNVIASKSKYRREITEMVASNAI